MTRFIARHPLLFGVLLGFVHLVGCLAVALLEGNWANWTSGRRAEIVAGLWLLTTVSAFAAAMLPALLLRRSGESTHRARWLVLTLPVQFIANAAASVLLITWPYRRMLSLDLADYLQLVISMGQVCHASAAVLAAPAALAGLLAAEVVARRRIQSGTWQTIVPPESPVAGRGNVTARFVADHPTTTGVLLMLPLAVLPEAARQLGLVLGNLRFGSDPGSVGYLVVAAMLPLGMAAFVAALRASVHRSNLIILGLPLVAAMELSLLTAASRICWGYPNGSRLDEFRRAVIGLLSLGYGGWIDSRQASILCAGLGAAAGAGLGLLYTRLRPRPDLSESEEVNSF